jgi:hypothetical protein
MGFGFGSFEGAVRARVVSVWRIGGAGVRGLLLSLLEELLLESLIVGDVVRLDMWCGG